MKTYLITGGAGFIGSNFIHYLRKQEPQATIINVDALTYAGNLENIASMNEDPRYHFVHKDICDPTLQQLFQLYEIDVIVHFAAESHVDRSIEDSQAFVTTNVLGTVNLLRMAKEAWRTADGRYATGKKFLQVSTDEVYGSLGATGLFTETTPLDPHSPYAASKASADLFVKAYYDTHQLPMNITRCSNNYGPYQHVEKLIPLVIQKGLRKQAIPLYGDGLNIRDWLYVEDHCQAIYTVIHHGKLGEIYNIGGQNERTNREIIKTILDVLQRNVDATLSESLITYVTDRKGHDRRYGIDARKIQQELGWKPATPFAKGIEQTVQWYIENQTWLQNLKD
ncbi:dTDP-glucose 4,6-dehydratase [Fictibacillus macauensis]|nr:dTDP-glucose 4,6-dehydratase [Fictibacillus macauensis]